ncbi:MAG TPA: hypothetical protein VNW28_07125 [Chthoniobacterales bacterium]|nr:hypothetical protein [Chthoniobacterales bacterium]
MKTLARRSSGNKNTADEVEGLRRVLDQSYAQLRERARAEWQRKHSDLDPSDACVRVCIRGNGQSVLT